MVFPPEVARLYTPRAAGRGAFWQIAPAELGEMMKDPDRERARRVMEAMLGMKKLDLPALRRAYEGR